MVALSASWAYSKNSISPSNFNEVTYKGIIEALILYCYLDCPSRYYYSHEPGNFGNLERDKEMQPESLE